MTRRATVPAFIQRAIIRTERERRASIIARPMRAMFDGLSRGEALEVDGQLAMLIPQDDLGSSGRTEYCAIVPAIDGWCDAWDRIAPDIKTDKLRYLAARLAERKEITERLIEQAREQFEACIARIPDMPAGEIESKVLTTRIAWELEGVRS